MLHSSEIYDMFDTNVQSEHIFLFLHLFTSSNKDNFVHHKLCLNADIRQYARYTASLRVFLCTNLHSIIEGCTK